MSTRISPAVAGIAEFAGAQPDIEKGNGRPGRTGRVALEALFAFWETDP